MPTAHRLVGELVDWGALRPRDRRRATSSAGGCGISACSRRCRPTLRAIASPFLHDLYGATFATVHLAVRDGTRVLYLDRLAGHASVPVVSDIGSRLPMHATGVGKVLLAYAPEPWWRRCSPT